MSMATFYENTKKKVFYRENAKRIVKKQLPQNLPQRLLQKTQKKPLLQK